MATEIETHMKMEVATECETAPIRMPVPVIILVGGPTTGKTRFHAKYTRGSSSRPTTRIKAGVTFAVRPGMVLIDTPGVQLYRNEEYSWEGVFSMVDLIVSFGNWTPNEVIGKAPDILPKIIQWNGSNTETMNAIVEYLRRI